MVILKWLSCIGFIVAFVLANASVVFVKPDLLALSVIWLLFGAGCGAAYVLRRIDD